MKLPLFNDASTKDGSGNKNARMTNMLREGGKAVVRPGLSLNDTYSGVGNGLIPFNSGSDLITLYGNTIDLNGQEATIGTGYLRTPLVPTITKTLLHFDDATVPTGQQTTADEYSNTVAFSGSSSNCCLTQSYSKWESGSLFTGGNNSYYVQVTGPVYLSPNAGAAWTLECWKMWGSSPGGFLDGVFGAVNNSGFGANMSVYVSGGNLFARASLSSNGTSNDIASSVDVNTGTNVAYASDTWFHFLMYYSPGIGYLFGINGIKYRQVSSLNSICPITKIKVGSSDVSGNNPQSPSRYTDEFRFSDVQRYSFPTAVPQGKFTG